MKCIWCGKEAIGVPWLCLDKEWATLIFVRLVAITGTIMEKVILRTGNLTKNHYGVK